MIDFKRVLSFVIIRVTPFYLICLFKRCLFQLDNLECDFAPLDIIVLVAWHRSMNALVMPTNTSAVRITAPCNRTSTRG